MIMILKSNQLNHNQKIKNLLSASLIYQIPNKKIKIILYARKRIYQKIKRKYLKKSTLIHRQFNFIKLMRNIIKIHHKKIKKADQ